jgi:hypothetical protein
MNHTTITVKNNTVTINGKRARRIYTGGSRPCFIGSGVIVKLNDQHWLFSHLRQSSRELRIWKQLIEPRDRKYFVAPIAGQIRGNGWIAQRIIKFRRGRRPLWAYRLIGDILRKYGIHDVVEDGDGKIYPVNWAMTLDGQPIIYDWGW